MSVDLNLIIATGTYPPEVSGQANFVYHLRQYFLKSKKFIQIKVISYGRKPNSDLDSSQIFFIKKNFFRHFSYLFTLFKISRGRSIIFAQDLISSGFPAALLKNRRHKMILRLGGDFLWEKMFNSGKSNSTLNSYYQQPKTLAEKIYLMVYRFVLWRSDIIIFTSRLQAAVYSDCFKLSAKKLIIIPNPLPTKVSFAKKFKNNNGEIIFAGRFIPLKNLTRLIKAFRRLDTDRKLVLIGSGPQENELKEICSGYPNIKIEKPITQQELFFRLSRAYLAVIPSITELSPNFALEALAQKIPVILTKENGLSEKIQAYFKLVNPFSVSEIEDALNFFLDARNYQVWLKKINNLNFENDFSWQNIADKYLKVFNF